MSKQRKTKDQSCRPFIQIDAELFKHLTPAELKVYGAIKARAWHENGECYESLDHMSKDIHISVNSIKRAAKSLLKQRIIAKEDRPGRTAIYTLTSPSEWVFTEWETPTKRSDTTRKPKPSAPGQIELPPRPKRAATQAKLSYHPGQIELPTQAKLSYEVDPVEIDPKEIHTQDLYLANRSEPEQPQAATRGVSESVCDLGYEILEPESLEAELLPVSVTAAQTPSNTPDTFVSPVNKNSREQRSTGMGSYIPPRAQLQTGIIPGWHTLPEYNCTFRFDVNQKYSWMRVDEEFLRWLSAQKKREGSTLSTPDACQLHIKKLLREGDDITLERYSGQYKSHQQPSNDKGGDLYRQSILRAFTRQQIDSAVAVVGDNLMAIYDHLSQEAVA